ncbi:MAG: response regulator transcription factor [Myxococcales bacterium]|nr:response regulator transcription factor [Myxococcales bacterium]
MRALLIDDDPKLHRLLTEYMADRGVHLESAYDGQRGLIALDADTWDVVLLDVMMPGIDGLEVVRRIRTKSAVPVIMLTARGDEADRVVGLELGADDYVPKPFSPRELLARMRAVTRRGHHAVGERLKSGELMADIAARQATWHGKTADLTGLEFDLLVALLRRAGRVVSRDALLAAAGRSDAVVGPRTVDVHISNLRKKLQAAAPKGGSPPIRTVRGIGYVLVEPT